MGSQPPSHPFEPRPRREIALVVVLLSAVTGILLLMTLFGTRVLSATRAYVAGEGHYVKAQKDALIHLTHYVETGDESSWEGYRESIAVPLADGAARRELLSADPDEGRVAKLFEAGRNHPEDTAELIWLFGFRRFFPAMEDAIAIWTEADGMIGEIDDLAGRVRTELTTEPRNDLRLEADLEALYRLGREVDRVGLEFSRTLGDAARQVASQLVWGASIVALVLVLFGLWIASRLLRRLQRKDAVFRAVIEDGEDLITLHSRTGEMVFANRAVDRVLGYRAGELYSRDLNELVHPDDRERVNEGFVAIARSQLEGQLEARWRHRSGDWRVLETAGGPMPGADRPTVVLSSRDLTEARALRQRMIEMQRLEGIGRLAGDVAHDFNNLLTTIGAGSQLVERGWAVAGVPDEEIPAEELELILTSTDKASELTRQLLAFARREAPSMVDLDLAELLRGSESLLERLVPAPVDLDLVPPADAVWVRGDRSQLQQVLMSLVDNAADAVGVSEGRVTVSVEDAEGPELRLVVSDDGHGIPEEIRGRVFEPFFTTKERGQGTGLGLATCHGIVQEHGGRLSIEDRPGGGTRLVVHLPRLADADSGGPPATAFGEALGGSTGRETR